MKLAIEFDKICECGEMMDNIFTESTEFGDGDNIWWCPCCGTACIISGGDMKVFLPDRTHKRDRQPPKDEGPKS